MVEMILTHVQFDQRWIKHVLPMHLKFITASRKSFGTCAIHILHDRESFCDDSCATWVLHKSEEVWGSFKAIPMHYHNGMSDSDLKESKGKRKFSYIQTKSRDCKYDS